MEELWELIQKGIEKLGPIALALSVISLKYERRGGSFIPGVARTDSVVLQEGPAGIMAR